MERSWTKTFAPGEVEVKTSAGNTKATLLCTLHKTPLRVEGTLLLDTDLPHEVMSRMPSLRDVRVTLRFNTEEESNDD